MTEDHIIPWNRSACRKVIDRLRDGLPPIPETIEFLTVGYDDCLGRAKQGLDNAQSGKYDVMLLEGRYGIGKSHMLTRISEIAQGQGFKVKRVEVGNGRVYFNRPEGIYNLIRGDDPPPNFRYYWRGDPLRKFVGQVKALADMYVKQGHRGLVILIDELENNFFSVDNFRSRAKSYRFLGALFKGSDSLTDGYILELNNVFVTMAITPGAIEWAKRDGAWCWTANPAEEWRVPDRITIRPLTVEQAVDIGKRIRAIHSQALDWCALDGVDDTVLAAITQQWISQGETRDERQLVKLIVEALELAEQDRWG
jgi:hypothetical protein